MVQVKIKGQVITAQYGILNTGDILRTDAAFAKHLVEDCAAAEYVSVQQEQTSQKWEDISALHGAEAIGDLAALQIGTDCRVVEPKTEEPAPKKGKKKG